MWAGLEMFAYLREETQRFFTWFACKQGSIHLGGSGAAHLPTLCQGEEARFALLNEVFPGPPKAQRLQRQHGANHIIYPNRTSFATNLENYLLITVADIRGQGDKVIP